MAEAATLAQPTAPRFAALPPLALYAHIPWCLKKCPYCDFNSHERRGSELPEARYVDALMADLEFALPSIWGRRVGSIFFGGGTPSLFSAASIDRALAGIRARVSVAPDAEITLEANPGTFEQAKFAGFREAGVNRLSIGIQSFDPKHLKALGRVHDEREAHAAAAAALTIFDNVNFDLMYALPGQTPEDARADADAALAYRPPHVSFYHLTIEPNTLFAHARPALPDDDTAAAMLDRIVAATAAAGLDRYEVSAFARAGHRSRHNVNYWEFGDYLGIGAGAHGKISFAHRIVRQVRLRDPAAYLAGAERGAAVASEVEVARPDLAFEFMLNALRLKDGFALARFAQRTGLPLSSIERPLAEAERRGLVERDLESVRPTPLGFDFLSDLQQLFLPSDN